MKTLFFLTAFVIGSLALQSADAQIMTLAQGKRYSTKIPERILDTPDWNEDDENPPLSAKRAIKAAGRMKDSLVEESDEEVWRLTSAGLHAVPLEGERIDKSTTPPVKWYWIVEYQRIPLTVATTGGAELLRLVVLMDGSAIKPDVKPWGPVKDE